MDTLYAPHTGIRALLVGGTGALGRHVGAYLVSHDVHTIVHGSYHKSNFRTTIGELRRINARRVQAIWAPIADHRTFCRKILRLMPVDIMIIFYGPYLEIPLSRTHYAHWNRMAASNFILPSALVSTNFAYLQQAKYGRVIGFASDYRTRMHGYTHIAAYAAAKWAFASTIQSAAAQNTNPNARYYLIAPGYIQDYSSQQPSPKKHIHVHSVREVADGVIALLDSGVAFRDGSVINLDRIGKKK